MLRGEGVDELLAFDEDRVSSARIRLATTRYRFRHDDASTVSAIDATSRAALAEHAGRRADVSSHGKSLPDSSCSLGRM
jgi:hypothetical protein